MLDKIAQNLIIVNYKAVTGPGVRSPVPGAVGRGDISRLVR